MAQHNHTGKKGEEIAANFLRSKGYEILDENWTHGKIEIDLIALYQHTLIFIEVKTRSSLGFGNPEEFVDQKKQQQMQMGAQAYLEIMEHDSEIRFDIIAVWMQRDNQFKITHFEDAFWPYE
jgi:putative endonuclease